MSASRTLSKEKKEITVKDLIHDIQSLITNKSDLVSFIKRPKTLMKGLEDLDMLVEMNGVKKAMIQQIRMLIVAEIRYKKNGKKKPSSMLHTIISGDPGLGKSKIARILAIIWHGLGAVSSSKIEEPEIQSHTILPTIIIPPRQYHSESSLMDLAFNISEIYTGVNKIYKNIVELQSSYSSCNLTQNIPTLDCKSEKQGILENLYMNNSNQWKDSVILCGDLNMLCLKSIKWSLTNSKRIFR
jgi:hypothetical protein